MISNEPIKVLDNGFIRHVESWGRGDCGEMEAGIIEAARQSTQGNFLGWEYFICRTCKQRFFEKGNHFNPDTLTSCLGDLNNDYEEAGDKKLLAYLYNKRHSGPFEFAGLTLEINAPIMVFREWHRHRTQSYNEMSARYAPLPNSNYIPDLERLFKTQKFNKQSQAVKGSQELTNENALNWLESLDNFYRSAEDYYQYGLDIGIPKELARLVIPVGRYSQMRATGNLRNWLAFLTLRMDPNAQDEIRQYATILGNEIIAKVFPRTWNLFVENTEFLKLEK